LIFFYSFFFVIFCLFVCLFAVKDEPLFSYVC